MTKKILFFLLCSMLLAACQEKMEERAERDARERTEKRCPMRLLDDGSLILERIRFDKATLTWRQEYLFDLKEEGGLNLQVISDALLQELRNTPSYKPYMDHGFNFQYVYCRMSDPRDTIINITLTPSDYR
jgi:hypothetical protein